MIPTKTGAAAALGLVLPQLSGRLDGIAMRVPTINVLGGPSHLQRRRARPPSMNSTPIDGGGVGERWPCPSSGRATPRRRLSIDFIHNRWSSIFDATQTLASPGTCRLVKGRRPGTTTRGGFSTRRTVALMERALSAAGALASVCNKRTFASRRAVSAEECNFRRVACSSAGPSEHHGRTERMRPAEFVTSMRAFALALLSLAALCGLLPGPARAQPVVAKPLARLPVQRPVAAPSACAASRDGASFSLTMRPSTGRCTGRRASGLATTACARRRARQQGRHRAARERSAQRERAHR